MDESLLEAQRDETLRELRALGPVFRGSLARVALTCGKANCRCREGRRHVAFYASYRSGGRAKVFHVPAGQVATVRAARAEWDRMKVLLERLADVQVSLWRVQHEQEKPRRKAESKDAAGGRPRGEARTGGRGVAHPSHDRGARRRD
jgi:hypothetical protein